MTELAGVAHIVLRVEDWKRSARWYQDVLGFERREGVGFTCFAHGNADFLLLFRPTGSAMEPTSSVAQRIDHLALLVPSIDTLEAWRIQLSEAGIDTKIEEASVGSSITLHDPDGLEIELFCPADGSPLAVGR